jgi:molybdenum cofactor biosynthesis protein B
MSVNEHRSTAPKRPVNAQVVVVSSTRTQHTDASGALIAELLEKEGHRVLEKHVVQDDAEQIRSLVRVLSGDDITEVVILTGGTGLSGKDLTPEALEPLVTRPIPGFGELFRWLSYQDVGAAAMLSRAFAAMCGRIVVFALPGSPNACRLALEKLVLPELAHVVRELTKEGPPPGAIVESKPAAPAAKAEKEPAPRKTEPEGPKLPAPTGAFGRVGRNKFTVSADQGAAAAAPVAQDDGLPRGWLRAVYEVRGEVEKGTYPELPEALEKVAPVVDVLHQSGSRGTLKLPNGKKYVLFGWPDLQSVGSKVLAIGEGSPIAEVLALHRWPNLTGTAVDEGGAVDRFGVAKVCEAITGNAPKDTSGMVFAVQGDAVWIERGGRAVKWDGTREKDDGTVKQALASLVLDWSRR